MVVPIRSLCCGTTWRTVWRSILLLSFCESLKAIVYAVESNNLAWSLTYEQSDIIISLLAPHHGGETSGIDIERRITIKRSSMEDRGPTDRVSNWDPDPNFNVWPWPLVPWELWSHKRYDGGDYITPPRVNAVAKLTHCHTMSYSLSSTRPFFA